MLVKIDREILVLERAISKSDFVSARRIIELHLEKFKDVSIRSKLSLDTITLINSVILFNQEVNKEVFSRETQLIVQHINKLAREADFNSLKRYCSLQEQILSNPKIYATLSKDAKSLIAPPKVEELQVN